MAIRRKPTTRKSNKRRGFTLVELMVVVVILGTLIALVGPNIWNMLFESNVSAAKTQMHNFGQAIDTYYMTNKKMPDSLQQLTETSGRNPHPFIKNIPPDPWNNEYEYRLLDSRNYQIRSYGEDGLAETEDDILYPEQRDN
jgi:general secretion pathway protein G